MTDIQVFAFIVLPALIAFLGYIAVRVFEHVHREDIRAAKAAVPLGNGSARTFSLIRADRSTHFKIVAAALVGAVIVFLVGVAARVVDQDFVHAWLKLTAPN